jgi:aminopeptidase N
MFRTCALAAAVLIAARAATSQPRATGEVIPPKSPRNASYSIDARLDPATRTITASEIITWRNITTRTVDDLQFHLYWNAWRDMRSTWLREATLAGTRYNRRADEWSRIDVSQLTIREGPDERGSDSTARAAFISPDDGNKDDRTVMSVPLPRPVGPGGAATIEIKWIAHVPRTFARTGAIGSFFFIAQWFPKLGVLQDEGWNCHQFHAGTEFFSDYGVYDVNLTVPNAWVVGATGVERGRRDNADQTTTHHYYQEDVHDFSWTTSPDYVERRERFEHATLPPVEMRLLVQPEHAGQARRHFDATRETLAHYGEWFGAYPYGHITIIDPAFQSDADGMEYPTLFTAGTRWLTVPGGLTPESVTVHEAGHQWWYGIVGSNEFEHAWMDEGVNTFATARVEGAAFTPSYLALRYFGGFVPYAFRDIVLSREIDRNRMGLYRGAPKSDVPAAPSYTYFPSRLSRNAITYAKTALWLNTLERRIGWETLRSILVAYFATWQFRHPEPRDFFETASRVGGHDLGWFFDEVYRSSNVFDYGVEDLKSTNEEGVFHTSAVVRRYGEGVFPVDVRVTFASGEQINEHWDGRDRWKVYSYDRPVSAISAQVDPERVLLLDINRTNNSRTLAPRNAEAATKWSLKWMVWLQHLLLTWALLA